MTPLKSLMALCLAFAAAGPARASTVFDSSDGKLQGDGQRQDVATGQPTATENAPHNASGQNLLNVIVSRGDVKDIAARFAQYLVDDGYVDKGYQDQAKANPDAIKSFQAAVAKAASKKTKTQLAELYLMIGAGTQRPSWLPAAAFQMLSNPAAHDWPKHFEAGMRCWRGDRGDATGCQANQKPFAGSDGARGNGNYLEDWTLGVTEAATATADQVYNDDRTLKDIVVSIGSDDGDAPREGKGHGLKTDLTSGRFTSDDAYIQGAASQCMMQSPQGGGCGSMISMKVVYDRDAKTGALSEALTVCDIARPGIPGGTGCETMPVSDSKDIMLAGRTWHVGFIQSFDDKGKGAMQVKLSLQGHDDISKIVGLGDLEQKLAAQAGDLAASGRGRVTIGGRDYVTVPYAHTVVVGYDGQNPIEKCRGALMYIPLDASGKPVEPPTPLFTVDTTQGESGKTVQLEPPLTALGCAGVPADQVDACHASRDPKDFMYLVKDGQGNYSAMSCADVRKIKIYKDLGYGNVDCGFPAPPDKPAPPADAGSKPQPGASGQTGGDQPPSPDGGKQDSKSTDVHTCSVKDVETSYPGFKALPSRNGNPWTILANGAGPGNDDRLCVNGQTLVVLGPGKVLDMIEDGHHEAGRDSVGIVLDEPSKDKWIPLADRSNGGVVLNPNPKPGEEPLKWDNGSGRQVPLIKRFTYFVPTSSLSADFLKKLDERKFQEQNQHMLPTLDDLADYWFIQQEASESPEGEEMWVSLPAGTSAKDAYQKVIAGFQFPQAKDAEHFQTSDEQGLLQTGLASALAGASADGIKITVQLKWEKKCSNQDPPHPLLVNALPVLTYNCDPKVAKIQTQADFQKYLDQHSVP